MKRLLYMGLIAALFGCAPETTETAFDWETEREARIKIDFSRTEAEIKEYIQQYIPDVTDEQMRYWEQTKALECRMIDGEKRYFRNAGPNLFRVDPEARAIKIAKEGPAPLGEDKKLNEVHIPAVIAESKERKRALVSPRRFRVEYTLTIDSDAVPEGETLRCWLPYPKDNQYRQKEVLFISASEDKYVFSPASYDHTTLYMEKKAVKGEATIFSEVFEYTSYAEWYDLKPEDVKPYDTSSEQYQKYTAERDMHIRRSPRMKALADSLAGDVENPLLKAQRFFVWINDNYPWASAREYSTIKNIPEYVLDNKHGDCGQVTLLFMNLCIVSGIPAHFQSGFMMHPNAWNLHDWCEIYFEGIGWVPVDQSFRIPLFAKTEEERMFFLGGIDAYRMIVNNDYSMPLYPEKRYPRSETVDFQRGEVEWEGGNLYFNKWDYTMKIEY